MMRSMQLRQIRERKGLTQRDLAEKIGMDAATVNRAEKMAASAKLSTYMKCADALGVELVDLFATNRTQLEQELLTAFRNISPARHHELIALMQLAREDRTDEAKGQA